MKNTYRKLVCCLLCCLLCLSACKSSDSSTPPVEPVQDAIYTVTVKTAGGMALDGLVAYVYTDSTEEDLLTYCTLDENGCFDFTAPRSDKYTVRFANLPEEGYALQDYYAITGTNTEIVLTSSVITGKDALEPGKTYKPGDVMRDFTVTTVDGQELQLSRLLQEKQAVVLNFWHTGSGASAVELPLLQQAWSACSDQVAVIAMNPTDISGDNAEKITQFQADHNLTLPVATCSGQWFSALGISAYPTTVIIDRYGVVCLVDSRGVDEAGVFAAAFQHFTAEPYQQKLLESFAQLHTVEYPVGHPKNPLQTNGTGGQFAVTVEPGAEFHVQLHVDGQVILRLEDANAYILFAGQRFEPNKKGILEVELPSGNAMMGHSLIIVNTGEATATFQVQVIVPLGTYSNPHPLELGELSVTVKAGNEEGVFYSWTATADGVLTVTVTDAPQKEFDIQLYNLTSFVVRTLNEEVQVDEDGNAYVSMVLRKGDVVSIGFQSAPDKKNEYPKVTIGTRITFDEGGTDAPNYSITVKDDAGNPMADVSVSLTVDGVNTVFVSDQQGMITMALPSGIYTVKVAVPEGYECDTTQFLLTAANPHKELVMKVYVPQEVPYTVYVVDEQGRPVANTAVVLGGSFTYTDDKGMVSVILLESKNYIATIVPPQGYAVDQSNHPFGSETVITVVLRQTGQVLEERDYTVKIVDQNGAPYTKLLVRFDSVDGALSVTESVDAAGQVTVRLPGADYQVTLVFTAGNTLGYDTAAAKLSPNRTSITIELAPHVSGSTQMIAVSGAVYEAVQVDIGSSYVDMEGMEIRYFLFTPTQTGVYTFTTTNPQAAIGYWNVNGDIADQSAAFVKDNVCTLTVEAVGQTYVLSISGGADIGGTVLKVARIGDVPVVPLPPEPTDPTDPAQPTT